MHDTAIQYIVRINYSFMCVYKQDTMKKLPKGSPAGRGTLTYSIYKKRYNNWNATTNVMACFHHAENLVGFSAKASIISMGCNILGVDKVLNLPKMSLDRLKQLMTLCAESGVVPPVPA